MEHRSSSNQFSSRTSLCFLTTNTLEKHARQLSIIAHKVFLLIFWNEWTQKQRYHIQPALFLQSIQTFITNTRRPETHTYSVWPITGPDGTRGVPDNLQCVCVRKKGGGECITNTHTQGLGSAGTKVAALPKLENKTKAGMNHPAASFQDPTPDSEADGLTRWSLREGLVCLWQDHFHRACILNNQNISVLAQQALDISYCRWRGTEESGAGRGDGAK